MPIPTSLEQALAGGDSDALEDAWLEAMADEEVEVEALGRAARTVADAGEEDRARLLLEMLDEHLRDAGRWEGRLALLRTAGDLLFETADLHAAIVESLERRYESHPHFAPLAEKVGLHRAPDDLPKTWKKLDRLAGLLRFEVGAVVHMKGKGAGRIAEVNLALESFRVELEGQPDVRVGFAAAPKLLELPPPGHIGRRRHEAPEELERLRDEDPPELLRQVLESYDRPRTAAEIRRDLAGIVPEARWNAWWTAARSHPQVVARSQGRPAYSWAESDEAARDALWRAFEQAAPRRRIELLRREGGRDPELKRRMVAALAGEAAEAAGDDPSLACEIWLALDHLGEAPASAAWSPGRLLAEHGDPAAAVAGIEDRALRESAYTLLREARPDWPRVYGGLLGREQDPRSLDLLAAELEAAEPERLESALDQLLSRPADAPGAFVWLAERAAEREDWRLRHPLRLLRRILRALGSVELDAHRPRLAALAEPGGTLPRLLTHLDEEEAREAAGEIHKARGLRTYQRKLLAAALVTRFPALRPAEEEPLYALRASIEAKRKELREIVEKEIPANRRAIEEARAHGDLRENFEYKAARQRHEYLAARAAALHRDLERARPIDPEQVSGGEVVIGSRVVLEGDGSGRTLTILGPWESRPEDGILSNESEAARELLGRKPGEDVEVAGERLRITRIEPYEGPEA